MANSEHEAILNQGVEVWNKWSANNVDIVPDLSDADLSGFNLTGADLRRVNLSGAYLRRIDLSASDLSYATLNDADLCSAILEDANLMGADLSDALLNDVIASNVDLIYANLTGADLTGSNLSHSNLNYANLTDANFTGVDLTGAELSSAHLSGTNLSRADLRHTDLRRADLTNANLTGANLSSAYLSAANLTGANLTSAIVIGTQLGYADISGCRIFGISAWKLNVENLTQSNLIITEEGEPEITVDNLEIAQFVYLLLNNSKLRSVIDTLTTKSVLILGRFTEERKSVLDGIREALRKHDYVPMLFDFKEPTNRDLTETIKTLAGLARFVILDLSDPHSSPHEVMSFAEGLLSVPVQGIFSPTVAHPTPYSMYEHIRRYPHVLPIYWYNTQEQLMDDLEEKIIKPAEEKVEEMRPPKNVKL